MLRKFRLRAFTIMEILVVIIIISSVLAFAFPNYQRAIARSHEHDAVSQLIMIHSAAQVYRAKNLQAFVGTHGLASINANLGLNIIANDMTYSYTGGDPNPNSFYATADYSGIGATFTLLINDSPVDPLVTSPPNPCCSAGACPTVASC